MGSVGYKDGTGAVRYRDIFTGNGTEANPDVMSYHDPLNLSSIGLPTDAASISPAANAPVISILKGHWDDYRDTTTTASFTLLDGVTATGAGSATIATRYKDFTFYFVAADVTAGGTIVIEVEAPNGSWHVIRTQAIAANTSGTPIAPYQISGAFRAIRGRVSAYTDGTFTLMLTAR